MQNIFHVSRFPITQFASCDFYFDILLSNNFLAHIRPLARFAWRISGGESQRHFSEQGGLILLPSGVLARIPVIGSRVLKTQFQSGVGFACRPPSQNPYRANEMSKGLLFASSLLFLHLVRFWRKVAVPRAPSNLCRARDEAHSSIYLLKEPVNGTIPHSLLFSFACAYSLRHSHTSLRE